MYFTVNVKELWVPNNFITAARRLSSSFQGNLTNQGLVFSQGFSKSLTKTFNEFFRMDSEDVRRNIFWSKCFLLFFKLLVDFVLLIKMV